MYVEEKNSETNWIKKYIKTVCNLERWNENTHEKKCYKKM